jgi:large subunit ribosomal protein L3
MPTRKSPRKGSLQFWPRKRAEKFLPNVNWNAIKAGSDSKKVLKGFIGYKAGMTSVIVKDMTPNSLTKDKKIVQPVTIIECPPLKILSVRFYRNGEVGTEVLSDNADKELRKKIKSPKNLKKIDEVKKEDFDDLKIIAYSVVKKTGIKKTPDISEIGLSGSYDEKFNFAKENLGKEIPIIGNFGKGDLVDIRGLTKGKGFQGPVKRFGLNLKVHKTEKGVRRPGSIGPWNPARTTFRAPMAGQIGLFTRVVYNSKIIDIGKGKFSNIKNYGNLNTDYLLVRGSIQGPAKRQILITRALRETKKQKKKEFEMVN